MEETIISKEELDKLLEYSCSIPTGVIIGKRWKRSSRYVKTGFDWMIGEYVKSNKPGHVGIKWTWAVSEPGCVHRG